jgi:prophage maintenance system killer protein
MRSHTSPDNVGSIMKGRYFMNKLTPEQLVLLNRKIIADDEASIPQVNFVDLKEITEIPYMKNEELFYIYKTAIEKAAKLGNLIVLRKPFVKANQETAVLALLTLLDINGYKMVNYSKDIEELCGYLEETKIDNTCKWINAHLMEEGYMAQNLNS